MKAVIWHNPNCGTSRKTLAILQEQAGLDLTVIEYLKNPPSRETLAALYTTAGIAPREGLRTRGSPAEEMGLINANDDTILGSGPIKSPFAAFAGHGYRRKMAEAGSYSASKDILL
jgi:arsenate reductase (glutaredoxin)